ncbi:AAA family ATPase [Actinomadura madurae]|nr:hypothetical protein [Actinomadura madurae]
MRQRVGIAQALLADPQLLIVDEPTAGLDPQERIRFRTLLSQFAGRRTVLLSTHIVDDIAQTCREVAVLAGGRLIFRGTAEELTYRARGQVWSVVTDGRPRPRARSCPRCHTRPACATASWRPRHRIRRRSRWNPPSKTDTSQ